MARGEAQPQKPGQWESGGYLGARCEICGGREYGQDVDWRLAGVFGSFTGRDTWLRFGARIADVTLRKDDLSLVQDHTEIMLSGTVGFDSGPFAAGLGLHYARQTILPFAFSGGLPAASIRIGWADGLSANLSFGEFGTFDELSGQFQMGLSWRMLPFLKTWAGLTGELAPAYGYEVGATFDAWQGLGLGAHGGCSFPDSDQYRFLGVGVYWHGALPSGSGWLEPIPRSPLLGGSE